MNRCARRILNALEIGGPRQTMVLVGLSRSKAEFEQAIGQLFLSGVVLWKGKTSGRRLALNGRRSKA